MDSKKLRYRLLMLIGIIARGTCGYHFVEHMPLFEAFYMTLITLSRVSFSEVIPFSQAGIMEAKGIATAVNSDANNVFTMMTAKSLRPDVFVPARASEQQNEAKLFRAGATRVA
ncbi:MAG: NAD-binding protein [Desulfobacterales bacterium]|jgi:hypothetical protein